MVKILLIIMILSPFQKKDAFLYLCLRGVCDKCSPRFSALFYSMLQALNSHVE